MKSTVYFSRFIYLFVFIIYQKYIQEYMIICGNKFDLFSYGLKQVRTYSVFDEHIYEMKTVTESGRQGIKTGRSFL